jgi:transforming growth factor-beta-induced protein
MKIAIKNLSLLFTALALVFTTACSNDDDDNQPTNEQPVQPTIADLASATDELSILVDALTATDLLGAVQDPNANLTVFAPNNQAFTNLLTQQGVSSLEELENTLTTPVLRNILLYHVLGVRANSDQVQQGYYTTLAENEAGFNLSLFANTASGVSINNVSTVQTADVQALNGVVHIVDAVFLPLNIKDLVLVNSNFSLLETSLETADNNPAELLDNDDIYTLFAPNNTGFGQLLTDLNLSSLEEVVGAIGTDGLFEVLAYHLVPGNVRAENVTNGTTVSTMLTGETFVTNTNQGVTLTDARARVATVVETDITGTNGTIHVINNVILPTE